MRAPVSFVRLAVATALALSTSAQAVEVIDLRPGYWELVWTYPDKTLHREFRCLEPQELEKMRFFMSPDKDCTLSPGSQTRRRYEALSVCGKGVDQMKLRWVFEAPDRMRFTVKATGSVQGQTIAISGTARWLQESCTVRGFPIS
jgi:hypothetical protein